MRYLETVDFREAALTMRVIGWTLLVHDAMFVAIFGPASMRIGSFLFPAWTVLQGAIGISLAVAGAEKQEEAAEIEGRLVTMPVRTEVRREERRVA